MLLPIVEALGCGRAGCACQRRFGTNLSTHCPCHEDSSPSLSVKEEGGKVLLHCHGGCENAAVIAALQSRDLWPSGQSGAGRAIRQPSRPQSKSPATAKARATKGAVAKTYDYVDEDGALLFQAVRFEPKGFSQRRPDGGGGWIGNLAGVRRVLYRLPEVLAGVSVGKAVWVAEGEKDVDALRALGLVATCNPMGAGKDKWLPEFGPALRGANVILLPDNDDEGRGHAQRVAAALRGMAARVRIVALPGLPEKGDVSDWLAAGGDAPQLIHLAKAVPDCKPEAASALLDRDFDCTDVGNGQRLAVRHGADLRFCHAWGQWLIWDGQRWKKDDTGEIDRRAKETAKDIYQEAADCPDTAKQTELAKHALRSQSHARLQSMIALANSEPGVPARVSEWDKQPWLLAVDNGTIDLKTGELRESQRGDMGTKRAGTHYDPDAAAPRWEAFLETVLPDPAARAFFQRAAGYTLTGDVSAQCLFFLYGSGSNGKSTALRALMDAMGDYALQAAPDLLIAREGAGGPNNDVAELQGTRLVATIEVEDGKRMAEGLVKQITGGDRIKARFMRQDFFEFEPTHKIFLAANHKPAIRGQDVAIWRRIKVLPFTVQIADAEKDPHLPEKLRAEGPGILAWAVRGCLDWQQQGLAEPPAVKEATEAYQAGEDVLGDFLGECCLLRPALRVTAAALYIAYLHWAEENSERSLSKKTFGTRLQEGRRIFPASGIGPKSARGWQGIGLVDTGAEAVCDSGYDKTDKSDPLIPMSENLIKPRGDYRKNTSDLSVLSACEVSPCASDILNFLSQSPPASHSQILAEMKERGHDKEEAKRAISHLQSQARLIENDPEAGGYQLSRPAERDPAR